MRYFSLIGLTLLTVLAIMASGCMSKTEQINVPIPKDGIDGRNGTSCWVTDMAPIGALISCTDGSSSMVLNGIQGAQGIQGPQGDRGIQGPVGQTGAAGRSCQVYNSMFFDGVWLSCPGQLPVFIADGKDGQDGKNGKDGKNGEDGKNGLGCTIKQLSNGVEIKCGTSKAYVYNGTDGKNGTNGTNGDSCSVMSIEGGANITCGNGLPVFIANGADGQPGLPGATGEQGLAGTSCNMIAGVNSTTIICGDNSQTITGAPGSLGIASILKPCSAFFASNDEVLMKLTDGRVLAVYDGGANLDRLTILVPNVEYLTTDATSNKACKFKVDANGNLTSEIQLH